jgi:hypothetical protein
MRLLTTFYLTLISFSSFGQNYFLFDQRTVDKIKTIEEQHNSVKQSTKRVFISQDFYPLANQYEVGFPISYLRSKDTLISSCMVEYYFTNSDSKVRLVIYDWDETRKTDRIEDRRKIMKVERQRFKAYNDKYDQLYKIISDRLGNPFTDDKLKEIITDKAAYKERTTKWKNGDLTIVQKLIFTTTDNELGTFRVRVKIYWD